MPKLKERLPKELPPIFWLFAGLGFIIAAFLGLPPIIWAFIGLGIIIAVHEFGHFVVAKLCGVKVLQFAIGFGPRILAFKIGETDYSINLLPLGGFVRLHGEMIGRSTEALDDPERSYPAQRPPKKIAILAAGGFANFLFAFLVMTVLFAGGVAAPAVDSRAVRLFIAETYAGFPAAEAGLRSGMEILEAESQGEKVSADELVRLSPGAFFRKYAGQPVTLTVREGEKVFQVTVTPRNQEAPTGMFLKYRQPGRTLAESAVVSARVEKMYFVAVSRALFDIVSFKKGAAKNLGGPVGIVSSMAAKGDDLETFAMRIAGISFMIGFFNLFFFVLPVLDGGQIVIVLFEWVRGRPISPQTMQRLILIGWILALLLMFWATTQDFRRMFPK